MASLLRKRQPRRFAREGIHSKYLINCKSSHSTFHRHHQASFPHLLWDLLSGVCKKTYGKISWLALWFEFCLLQFTQQDLREGTSQNEVTSLPQDTRKQMLREHNSSALSFWWVCRSDFLCFIPSPRICYCLILCMDLLTEIKWLNPFDKKADALLDTSQQHSHNLLHLGANSLPNTACQ